jgi:hypothetical protein
VELAAPIVENANPIVVIACRIFRRGWADDVYMATPCVI